MVIELNIVFEGHFIGKTRLFEQEKYRVQLDGSAKIPFGFGHANATKKTEIIEKSI